ncbi:class I SAM-dependent methyltransferase [Alphaproteobacteria bacterium]|nr:class I SAM-dependent methyltransferase [Alphaproteobacteria bacterium]
MTPSNSSNIYCACCGGNHTETVLTLAPTPLEDQFLTSPTFQPTFNLELVLCTYCGFCFLPFQLDPNLSYNQYMYNTKVTVGLDDHYSNYVNDIVRKWNVKAGSFAVDLGSNDGTMVAALNSYGLNAIGVEPAGKVALLANDMGRKTINTYFTRDLGKKISLDEGKAKIITANYMFANIPDVDDFVAGVNELLDNNGIFIVQTGYHPDQFNLCMFDYIYHEHFSYFTLCSLQSLYKRHGLEIIDVDKQSPKGGSIRVFASKIGQYDINVHRIKMILNEEKKGKWNTRIPFDKLRETLDLRKKQLTEILSNYKKQGLSIVGFGASHSTTTLIYEFELNSFLDYIVDDNEVKHETFSPGFHIPVYSTQKLYTDNPDILVVLAWQHQVEILKRHSEYNESSKFIIPLPEIKVI